MLLASSGYRPGMLLSIQQCTEQAHKNGLSSSKSQARLRNPTLASNTTPFRHVVDINKHFISQSQRVALIKGTLLNMELSRREEKRE